ncbi:MAG: hypothetical protein CYPHOPRED_000843 [Cyphobasidiales sp. Tagirdzhanova-0007]|nr:MAG: hypothetical protein CYPHOPRED_000843 [Cyphobasidiales sp. Tagirdzhanova-0007]
MRRDILVAAILGAVSSVSGAAVQKRQATAITDADILNFALILEHFESTFYSKALAQFDANAFTSAGFSANVRTNIEQIAADEAQHVSLLTGALTEAGATPVQACNYSVPYSDVTGFLGLAQVFEGVGTSAYLGAASLIQNKAYLTVAGSILTAEARHDGFVRLINSYSPFVMEDTPLDPTSVTSLVAPFFSSCPSGSAPSFTPFPAANLTTTVTTPGSTLEISAANATGSLYCIFFSGVQTATSPYANGSCVVPTANVSIGQAYAVISNNMTFSDAAVVAGPVILQFDVKNNTGFGSTSNSSGSASMSTTSETAKTGAAAKTHAAVAGISLALVALGSALLL